MPFLEAERIKRIQESVGISARTEKVRRHDNLIYQLLNSDSSITTDEQGELTTEEYFAIQEYRDFQKKVRDYTSSIANLHP